MYGIAHTLSPAYPLYPFAVIYRRNPVVREIQEIREELSHFDHRICY